MASTTAEAAAGTTAGAITEPNRTGGGGMKIPPPLILETILEKIFAQCCVFLFFCVL